MDAGNENQPAFGLTDEEREMYEEQGYFIRKHLFSPEEIDRLCGRIDALVEQVLSTPLLEERIKNRIVNENVPKDPERVSVHSIFRAHLYSRMFREHIQDRRVVDPVSDLLGNDLFCPNDLFFYKEPGKGHPIKWHQDSWYFNNHYTPHPGEDLAKVTIGTWQAFDDAYEENGCLWIVPKSHKEGLYTHEEAVFDQSKVEVRHAIDESQIPEGAAMPVEVPKGSVIFFNNSLLHASRENVTKSATRKAYVVHYMKSNVKPTSKHTFGTEMIRFGPMEAYASGARIPGCVEIPAEEDCIDLDTALGRELTASDLDRPVAHWYDG